MVSSSLSIADLSLEESLGTVHRFCYDVRSRKGRCRLVECYSSSHNVSEFSIPSALDSVKPLKALVQSNHPEAKKVAARMMKTTAVVMQLGGGAGEYQHYFKPRMSAMAK